MFLQKILAGFREIPLSSSIRAHLRPEDHQSKEETDTFHLASLPPKKRIHTEKVMGRRSGDRENLSISQFAEKWDMTMGWWIGVYVHAKRFGRFS